MSALDVRCQIREIKDDLVVAKCGLTERRQQGRIPESMTAWGSLVTCPMCRGEMTTR